MPALDQFYTAPSYARQCVAAMMARLPRWLAATGYFIDPSAGGGAFYDLLPEGRRLGMDLAPAHADIIQADFLTWQPDQTTHNTMDKLRHTPKAQRIVIGNPPFGGRGDLARQFLCHAAEIADTIGFILPMCFRKYALHRKLPIDLRLIAQIDLPRDAFHLPTGKKYQVKTQFQIWSRGLAGVDWRRRRTEAIAHPDFIMHQYNNTREAEGVFARQFDFAVPCQGWQDYTRRETDPDKCERTKQWMLFHASTTASYQKLHGMDYGDLAYRVATAIPGFRKCDVVEAYQTATNT